MIKYINFRDKYICFGDNYASFEEKNTFFRSIFIYLSVSIDLNRIIFLNYS